MKMEKIKKAKQKGFALIEVLIAALVLTIGALGFLKLQTIGLNGSQSSFSRTEGIGMTTSMVEFFRANGRIVDTNGDLSDILGDSVGSNPLFLAISKASGVSAFTSVDCSTVSKDECAKGLVANQKNYIEDIMSKNFAPGRAMLCATFDTAPERRNHIRIDFIWRDNNNSRVARENLEKRHCPTDFYGVVNDEETSDFVKNFVTVFAEL